ncbi:transmembrane protein 44 isoform X2 [Lepus europaeus]|uniref:transmembrane protein 44 isoform X2 n=1 Tax=Lepus europaeus TaxID=9983 RepID=UPI002B49334D|nr:transmembrane protein 44 isoform X2 [Lepus europaeus]
MGEAPSPAPAPALWDWEYLDRCFARHRVCISFGLWICAASCWIAAHALLLYLRCTRRGRREQSALCAACCLLASLCDAIGAILARQLTIQVFTGAYLAAVDLANFVFILFPVCGSKFKPHSGGDTQERKRRRRLRASIFALALPLSLGPGWALWAAVPKASALVRGPQRRLLGSLLQDEAEVLGYLLGVVAALGSWATRIPPLSRICRGKPFPSIHLWARALASLAGLLYASAIVAHDRQPEYLLRATPWLLTSLGRAALDVAIILLSCAMKSKRRRALALAAEATESADTEALLTCADPEEESQEARTGDKKTDWMPLTTLSHGKSLRAMAAISHYLELTIEPVQQAGCSATRLPGDGRTRAGDASPQEPPSYPPVQVIRARVSSSSSSEVSSINSDLEWDPEDVNLEGHKGNMEPAGSQSRGDSLRPVDLTLDD